MAVVLVLRLFGEFPCFADAFMCIVSHVVSFFNRVGLAGMAAAASGWAG